MIIDTREPFTKQCPTRRRTATSVARATLLRVRYEGEALGPGDLGTLPAFIVNFNESSFLYLFVFIVFN